MTATSRSILVFPLCLLPTGTPLVAQLDQDGDRQSDIWEIRFAAAGLAAGADADGDGWSNASESTALLATDRLASAKPGFVDRLTHGAYSADADAMATFEKAAGKLKSVRVL